MGLKILWTNFSKTQLRQIYDYYKETASVKVAGKIFSGIVAEAEKLSVNPEIGQLEILVFHPEKEYRYLVHRNYKIVYLINSNTS
ncbi:type II toxin-antitoxin system RelE/ParE family toxin [Flavobacterium sp. J372]|uniref:type II toxin-antitoxin system RelE/ParE family toxin n=1 Tax=Flavobacterium sp. J372 TaxID=2898436 RepID=UPI0021512C71|nr:type II toxin-antitoxin system RelE/ParE family toxin [Flavobacterium sp. J372]MCR5863021.1 type II toxin-antitoxin system RelE/ParE family toxin [Flavobacterium sp. J372]